MHPDTAILVRALDFEVSFVVGSSFIITESSASVAFVWMGEGVAAAAIGVLG